MGQSLKPWVCWCVAGSREVGSVEVVSGDGG